MSSCRCFPRRHSAWRLTPCAAGWVRPPCASINDCYRGAAIDRAKAVALIDAARGEAWFEHAFLPDPRKPSDDVWQIDLDFDVRPALRALDVPALALFGGRDRWVPVDRRASSTPLSSRPTRLQASADCHLMPGSARSFPGA
jgi:pimeloyl-ACP methyl ester carboxylesterase